eukprot:TRINITY_DN910_c0_g1_i3.p1 TRINITY_DN910_c0_g1~~TRINITY_DN910_c0_g1_i3.p1  ORF type:complete len:919 (+),score=285.69 TRINITY_DN910_c0_g1_i3:63-2819(+)
MASPNNPMVMCTLCEKEVAWKDWEAHKKGKVHKKSAKGVTDEAALQVLHKEAEDKAGYVPRAPKVSKPAPKPAPKPASKPAPKPAAANPRTQPNRNNRGNQNSRLGIPLRPINFTIEVKRGKSSPPFGATFSLDGSSVRVSSVEAGSPASVVGLIPSLVVQQVNNKNVKTVAVVKKTVSEGVNFTLLVVADSSGLLPGGVTSWNKERGFGFICPSRPLFTQEKMLGDTTGVYFGDIRCNSYSLGRDKLTSLAEGQEVEFEVQHDGRYFGIKSVQGVAGGKMVEAARTSNVGPRAGADISSLVKTKEAVCMPYTAGRCTDPSSTSCSMGVHIKKPGSKGKTSVDEVMVKVSSSKLELLQQKWTEIEGPGRLVNGWQLRNDDLEFRFRATEYNMTRTRGRAPDMIDGFHGTAEDNVLSIAQNGFDPFRRSGQVHGAGEYFAKDPKVSVGYCRGGCFMFLCRLILGEAEDHKWVPSMKYYIMKQNGGNIQALPMYLLQFKKTSSPLALRMSKVSNDEKEAAATLLKMGAKQRGGLKAEKGRIDTAMVAQNTRHLWLGWLNPAVGRDDEELAKDVKEFLKGHQVKMLKPERNAARVGAFVELETPVNQLQMAELNCRLYHGEHIITVDNAQPDNPYMRSKPCPRLNGPSRYCRGWNIKGHCDWTETCSFKHDASNFINYGANLEYTEVSEGSAKYEELATEMRKGGLTKIKRIRRVVNKSQERAYESRRSFSHEKHGCVVEKELWHGTACSVLDKILASGLQCPSDSQASEACPVSGGKGLATTLCGTDCKHCTEKHEWKRCHMFGLGIYLADQAEKSHRYVTPEKGVYSLVKCRVNLGNPYLIEANLKASNGLHDVVRCVDPSAFIKPLKKVEWDLIKSHDSYYVKGLGSNAKTGFGVINSEYIIFQPAQVLPLYVVDYKV